MGDFDSDRLLTDWDDVLDRAGALTALCAGVTFSGVWAQRTNALAELEEQLRDEKRFTIFTTATELATTPTLRQVVTQGATGYFVEAVRADAEGCGIEIDVQQIL